MNLPPGKSDQSKHRLLALDGGGIRGVLTLEILAELEHKLAARYQRGEDYRLCEFFDYIAGTSTGAIIAAGLACGMSAAELLAIYTESGKELFDKAFLLERVKYLYKSEPIANVMRQKFGADTTLGSDKLKCLLLVITQNLTTDSPWPISSNPKAKYNASTRPDCNLKIPLWKLVRASTAAPVYFPPEVLQWDENDPSKSFVFVDGGMTPYNNPAFVLFRMATHGPFGLNWPMGEDKLLLVSVGTGSAPSSGPGADDAMRNLFSNVANIPGALMNAMQRDQDINCRTIGRCTYGAAIDREVGDMIPRDDKEQTIPLSKNLNRAFLYARYDAEVTRPGLDRLGLPNIKPEDVQKLDSVKNIPELSQVGKAVARDIAFEHYGSFV